MRICYYFRHLNDPLGRGVHGRSLVEAWSASGNPIICLPHPPAPYDSSSEAPMRGIVSRIVPRPARHRLMQTYDDVRGRVNAPRILRRLEGWETEVLVARWSQFDSMLDRLVSRVSCPVVAEVNAVIHREMLRFRGARLPNRQVRRELDFLRAADLVICVSEEVRKELLPLGVHSERTAVVPNGVDCTLFRPDVRRDEALEDWANGGEGKLVAYCGTSSLVHDMSTLLLATERLADSIPKSRFLFVGPLARELAPLVRRRGDLADRIRVTGGVLHHMVPPLLAPATLLWTAYASEYVSPLKQLEYMAMGKPVVVAGEGPAARTIAAGKCGTAVAIGDHQGLAQAAAEILLAPGPTRDSLGGAGREWVVANGSWSAVAESMLRLIRERLLSPG